MDKREEMARRLYAIEYDAIAYPFENAQPAEQDIFRKFADAAILSIPDAPSRETLGRAIYLAMYQHKGGRWEANETKDVWYDMADRFTAFLPPAAPTTEPVAWRNLAMRILSYFDLNARPENDLAQGYRKELAAILFAPPVAAPEDAVRELVQQLREKALWREDVHHDLHIAAADMIEQLAALPAKDGAGSQVTRPNRGAEA